MSTECMHPAVCWYVATSAAGDLEWNARHMVRTSVGNANGKHYLTSDYLGAERSIVHYAGDMWLPQPMKLH